MTRKDLILLRLWLDSEIALLHILLAVTIGALTHSTTTRYAVAAYIAVCSVYGVRRTRALHTLDPNYLKIPIK